MTLPSHDTLVVVGSALVAFLTGALGALKAVAPHTETKVDDKIADELDKGLPYLVRVLEWLRK